MPKLTIVIPAYNEEGAIASICERTLAARSEIMAHTDFTAVNIVVVSDGSWDKTPEIAAGYTEIKLVAYEKNKGYGAAIKIGFSQTDDEYVSFLDADGTCDPLFFIELFKQSKLHNADVVLGSRMGENSEMPKVRRLGNTLFATLMNIWSGSKIKDTASGMRLIKRSSLESLYPLPDGLHFTPAMSAKAIFNKKLVIVETPMPYKERIGVSKLNIWKDGVRFLRVIVETAVQYKPRRITNIIGIILLLVCVGFSISPIKLLLDGQPLADWMIYRVTTIFCLLNCAILLIGSGFIMQGFVDLVHYKSIPKNNANSGFLANLILKHGLLCSLICFIASAIVVFEPAKEYLTQGTVSSSWLRVMSGAFLFLIGFQTMILGATGVIFNILQIHLKDKQ